MVVWQSYFDEALGDPSFLGVAAQFIDARINDPNYVADFELVPGVVEAGRFGNKFLGATDADGVVGATFAGAGTALHLDFDGYDIDWATEVEVLLNGNRVGFLDTGVNNGLKAYQIVLSAADQVIGENIVEFQQAVNPTYAWGVTNLRLTEIDRLELGITDTVSYGNKFNGQTEPDGVATFAFHGCGVTLQLDFDGYDVDWATEVEVLLNGTSLGFLDAGVNNGLQTDQILLSTADQVIGENILEFRQAVNPSYAWGVTNLHLSAVPRLEPGVTDAGSYGNNFNGQTEPDGVATFSFVGTATTLQLEFDGYDVDWATEVEVLLNGNRVGFLDTGVNNGLKADQIVLSAADQMTGENILEFRQTANPVYTWGVTNLHLSGVPRLELGVTDTGSYGNKFNGQTDADGVEAFVFTGTGTTLQLVLDGYDIDWATEVEVLLNGRSLGFLDAGVNNGLRTDQILLSTADQVIGENILEFRQAVNPSYAWGVTDLLLTEIA